MNTQLAIDITQIASAEVKSIIRPALESRMPLENNRMFLERARDRLHDACRKFEDLTYAEQFDFVYLPLFDALATLTQALRCKPICRDHVIEAAALLEEVSKAVCPTVDRQSDMIGGDR